MTKEELINIIHNGETSDVEFKSAAGGFPGVIRFVQTRSL